MKQKGVYRLKWICLLTGFALASYAQRHPLDFTEELRARKGLPHFFAKLRNGDPVSIAYFGGSITAAGNGWRDQSAEWIQRQFPAARVRQFNSAIGGTGSDLGVFRLKSDVLIHQPDLVFVEFAVNDNGLAPERILRTMEGIVRQVWKANKRTDICFVYTLTSTTAPTLAEGRLTPAMLAMEQVAEHYGIPSVQLGLQIVEFFKSGKLVFKGKPEEYPDKLVFSGDNVHPYPQTGHRIYAEALARALEKLKVQGGKRARKTGKPLNPDHWGDAQMIPVAELRPAGAWQLLSPAEDSVARQFRARFPALYKASKPGASFSIRFEGRLAGLYDVVGPGCGAYMVTVDQAAPGSYPRFDKYSVYYRSHYFFLPETDPGMHTVKWEVSGEKPDKMAILSEGAAVPGDPAKFGPHDCYAGYLLLLGVMR